MQNKSVVLIVNDVLLDRMDLDKDRIIFDKSFDRLNIDDGIIPNSLTLGKFYVRNPYDKNAFTSPDTLYDLHIRKIKLTCEFFALLGATSVCVEEISIKNESSQNSDVSTQYNKVGNHFSVDGSIERVIKKNVFLALNSKIENSASDRNNKDKSSSSELSMIKRFFIEERYGKSKPDINKARFLLKDNYLDKDEDFASQLRKFESGLTPKNLTVEIRMDEQLRQANSTLIEIGKSYNVDTSFKLLNFGLSLGRNQENMMTKKEDTLKNLKTEYHFKLNVNFQENSIQ